MAVRIAGVTIPNDKRVIIALTYIYGIGPTKSAQVVAMSGVNPSTRVKDLSEEKVNSIRNIIEKQNKVEGDLRRDVMSSIKRLKDINCYRGTRHVKGLPCRGQRTKTNNRSVRGNARKTMGSGRAKAAGKT
ncbi:MAG: 30S ribosomal protein S13 [bacterium]